MKRRNLIFGLIAIVFAVGSAFASRTASVTTYVHAKATSTSNWTLTQIQQPADGSGSNDYTVSIAVSKSGVGSRTVFGRNASGVVLKHNSATVVTATIVGGETPYDVTDTPS